MEESFYFTSPLSVHDYLNYIDFFIFIWFKEVGKRVIAVITAMFVTVGTLLIATTETIVTLGKRTIAVIVIMPVTARTLLVATAETAVTPGIRSDQIGPSKDIGNTLSFKV